jgi:hypothetical protein
LPRFGELDVAALDLGEAQHLQGLGRRKQVIDLEMLLLGDRRQVGLAVVGWLVHRLHETGEHVR